MHDIISPEFYRKKKGYKQVFTCEEFDVWSVCHYDEDTNTLTRLGYDFLSKDRKTLIDHADTSYECDVILSSYDPSFGIRKHIRELP